MEGVTSLVMFPQLVDNDDPISNIQHQLATGQWARCLEQDFKMNEISTVGDLAGMDNKAVTKLRGVKPPKPQTVKTVLGIYYNKIKREENVVRKGTPVQEETSQEEEDRIKEDIFSRPSPSPTDMAVDIDSSQDDSEDQKEKTESKDIENQPEEVKTVPDTESDDVEAVKEVETVPDSESVNVEVGVEEVKTVPETESIVKQAEEKGVPEETECPIIEEKSVSKDSEVDEDKNDGMEVEDVSEENAKVENTPDSTSSVDNQPEDQEQAEENEEKNEEESQEEIPSEEVIEKQSVLDVRDVMSVLDSDMDPNNLSDTDLKTLISTFYDHSKKVEAMKERAIQTVIKRLR